MNRLHFFWMTERVSFLSTESLVADTSDAHKSLMSAETCSVDRKKKARAQSIERKDRALLIERRERALSIERKERALPMNYRSHRNSVSLQSILLL